MVSLSKIPAIGFQLGSMQAYSAHQRLLDKTKNKKIERLNAKVDELKESLNSSENLLRDYERISPSTSKDLKAKSKAILSVQRTIKKEGAKLRALQNKILALRYKTNGRSEIKKAYQRDNYKKIGGYIPLVGSILGIKRIVNTAHCSHKLTNKKLQYLRGGVEFSGLGFLLIGLDLGVTAARASAKQQNYALYNES